MNFGPPCGAGRIEVIRGSPFGGKIEELIRRLLRVRAALPALLRAAP